MLITYVTVVILIPEFKILNLGQSFLVNGAVPCDIFYRPTLT